MTKAEIGKKFRENERKIKELCDGRNDPRVEPLERELWQIKVEYLEKNRYAIAALEEEKKKLNREYRKAKA